MCGHWRSPLDAQASVAQTNANDKEKPHCLVSIENPTAKFSIGGSTVRLATQHMFFVGVMEGLHRKLLLHRVCMWIVFGMELHVGAEGVIRDQFVVQATGRLTQIL